MVIVLRDHTQLHTHTNTISGTPYEGSTRRRDLYVYKTQHSTETDMNDLGGFRTRKRRKRAAADLLLRPRGYRDRLQYRVCKCMYVLCCMGAKLGRTHWGRNVHWVCLRIGCWGEYLGLRGTSGENYIKRSFMICTPRQYYSVDQIEKAEMSGACSMYGGEEKCLRGFGSETWGKRPLGIPRHKWEENIKMDLQEVGCGLGPRTGLIWLRIGTGGGHL